MFRLFALLSLLFLNLFACQGGYTSCVQKINDAKVIQNSSLLIPVKNHKLLIYSNQQPNAKILKYDPFLSLYLVEDRKKFAYPYDVNMRLQLGTAMVNNKRAKEGKILKNQVGLNLFAHYSEKLKTPALITSSCCSLEGIVTPRGVIQKEYIQRFLSASAVTYADIGIRVKNDVGYVIVRAINPYLKNNPFQKEDCIISLDGKKVHAASVFMRKILFSKIGSKHSVIIKRGKKKITLHVKASKRYGGGFISDTFLEEKGIYFDKSLHIIKLNQFYKKFGLKVGDRLLGVNKVAVKNERELEKYIENFKDFSLLLFERKNFQFFVKIK